MTACRLQDLYSGIQVSSPARRSVPRVDDSSVSLSAVSTRRHLRSAGQGVLVVLRTRTADFSPRSLSVAGPLAWNSLPPEIKTSSLTLRWKVLWPAEN